MMATVPVCVARWTGTFCRKAARRVLCRRRTCLPFCIGTAAIVLLLSVGSGAQTHPAATTTTRAADQDLAGYVPADVLIAFWGRPSPDIRAGDHVVMRLLRWVEVARELNLIPAQYRTISDIAGSLPPIVRHDHVLMLMDVSSRPIGVDGYRLAHMQVAVVVATEGRNDEIVDRVRLLLSSYTDKEFGQIEPIRRQGTKSYRLTDSRLPGWATWEWGPLGSCYVVGVGAGAFDRVVDTYGDPNKSIRQDPWFANARAKCRGEGAMIEWLVNYEGIHRELEPVVKGRPERVLEALGAAKLQRGLCTFRLEDRYLACYIMHRLDGQDVFVPLSDPQRLSPERLRVVPPEASCAVMELDLADWVQRLCNAYLASQSDSDQKQLREWFKRFEEQRGVDARTQFLDRLGHHMIVHTWPPHPLKLPLTFTLLVAIDDPVPVRDFVDALMGAWRERLRRPAATTTTTAATTRRTRDRFRWTIGREPDGMWYLQAGLVRPAVAVAERYLVISWSPEAVRANLEFLGKVDQRPVPVPTTTRQ